jgi:hypothetical protein
MLPWSMTTSLGDRNLSQVNYRQSGAQPHWVSIMGRTGISFSIRRDFTEFTE